MVARNPNNLIGFGHTAGIAEDIHMFTIDGGATLANETNEAPFSVRVSPSAGSVWPKIKLFSYSAFMDAEAPVAGERSVLSIATTKIPVPCCISMLR